MQTLLQRVGSQAAVAPTSLKTEKRGEDDEILGEYASAVPQTEVVRCVDEAIEVIEGILDKLLASVLLPYMDSLLDDTYPRSGEPRKPRLLAMLEMLRAMLLVLCEPNAWPELWLDRGSYVYEYPSLCVRLPEYLFWLSLSKQ